MTIWNVEVGCERIFSLTGYISAPHCTRLGVRTYKQIAMLASMLPKVYIGMEWVAQEYLKRCKEGQWKKENTQDALKCWNLERVLDSEMYLTLTPPPLTLDQLLAKNAITPAPLSDTMIKNTNCEVSGSKVEDFLADHV